MDHSMYSIFAEAEDHHWWFVGRRAIFTAALRRTPPRGRGSILDVGCGTGGMYALLKDYGEVTGVDANAEAVAFAKNRGYRQVILADARHLPFPDCSFDLVAATDLIEHLPDEQPLITELIRVLKPGGVLLVTSAAFTILWSRLDELSHHYRRYTRTSFTQTLTHPSLNMQMVRYYNVLLFPSIAIIRLFEHILPHRKSRAGQLRELRTPSRLLNGLLRRILSAEKSTLFIPFPFGVSLLGVCRKKL